MCSIKRFGDDAAGLFTLDVELIGFGSHVCRPRAILMSSDIAAWSDMTDRFRAISRSLRSDHRANDAPRAHAARATEMMSRTIIVTRSLSERIRAGRERRRLLHPSFKVLAGLARSEGAEDEFAAGGVVQVVVEVVDDWQFDDLA